jgi:hypothetical protein
MPGRKASSDSDLAVQFVLSGKGRAIDAQKRYIPTPKRTAGHKFSTVRSFSCFT